MCTELLCKEGRLRTQNHLVLLLIPQQACEKFLFVLGILEVLALLCVLDILEVLDALHLGCPCQKNQLENMKLLHVLEILAALYLRWSFCMSYKHFSCSKAPVTLFIDPAGE